MSDNFLKPIVKDFKPISEDSGGHFAPLFPLNPSELPKSHRGLSGGLSFDRYKMKLEGCGKRFLVLECQGKRKNEKNKDIDCKTEYPILLSCGLRTCPVCAKKRSFDLYKEICEIVEGLKFNNLYRLRHIVLTWGTEGSIDYRVQKTLKAFAKLWRNYLKPLSVGAVMSLEVGSKNGSVHLHILFYGLYVDVENLRKKWYKLTGKYEVFIREVSPKAKGRKGIKEALKYATKGVCSDLSFGYEIEKALRKVRRVRRYGIFYVYEAKKGVGYDEKYRDFFEDKTPVFCSDFICPRCGSTEWKLKRDVNGGILYLDCEYDFDRLEVLNLRYYFGVFKGAFPNPDPFVDPNIDPFIDPNIDPFIDPDPYDPDIIDPNPVDPDPYEPDPYDPDIIDPDDSDFYQRG